MSKRNKVKGRVEVSQVTFSHQEQKYHDSMADFCRGMIGGPIISSKGEKGTIRRVLIQRDGVYLESEYDE